MEGSKVILIIEEDEDDCAFFSEIVIGTGIAVDLLCEKSCEVALSKIRTKTYQIPNTVFLGITVPNEGPACLAALRSVIPLNIPIYVAAPALTRPVAIEMMNAGGSGVLNKSGDFQTLRLQIERAVRVS